MEQLFFLLAHVLVSRTVDSEIFSFGTKTSHEESIYESQNKVK